MCLRVALPVRPPIINTAMPPVYRVIKILAKICINFGECCAGGKLLFGADRWLLNRLWISSTDQPSPNNPCIHSDLLSDLWKTTIDPFSFFPHEQHIAGLDERLAKGTNLSCKIIWSTGWLYPLRWIWRRGYLAPHYNSCSPLCLVFHLVWGPFECARGDKAAVT